MQTTIKQQIEAITEVIKGDTEVNTGTPEEMIHVQCLRDTLDTLQKLEMINFEEIRFIYTQFSMQQRMGHEDVDKYLRGLESLDLLIETFRG